MKKLVTLAIAIATIAVLGSSCEREIIEPQSQDIDLTARVMDGNQAPQNTCATPQSVSLKEEAGNVIGTLEISNTSTDEMFLNSRLNHGWLLTDVMFYVGDRNNLPKGNSDIVLEEMPYQFHLANPRIQSIFQVPIGNQAPCFDVVFWFRAKQYNFFGQVVATTQGWADGTSILDGYYQSFCPTPCNVQSSSSQSGN